jgi:hypothetical protein
MASLEQNEFDKYFPVETNTGDLNLPDFDFSDFTGVVGFDNSSSNNNSNNSASASASASSAPPQQQQPIDTTNATTASSASSSTNHGQQHQQQRQRESQDQQHQREDLSDVNFSAMSFFPPGPGTYYAGTGRNQSDTDRNSRNQNSR